MMKSSVVWLGDGSEQPTGDKEGHRVGLERATLCDGKNGTTHTKRKRAFFCCQWTQINANRSRSARHQRRFLAPESAILDRLFPDKTFGKAR